MIKVTMRSNLGNFDKFRKGIGKPVAVKIGVLGTKDARTDGSLGNAGIGIVQEFGSLTKNIPARSFLRMPLETKKERMLDVIEANKELLLKGDVAAVMDKVGFEAENIIDDAFKTGGFGQWKPNAPITVDGGWMHSSSGKPFYIKGKGSSKPLIHLGELRKSITHELVKK